MAHSQGTFVLFWHAIHQLLRSYAPVHSLLQERDGTGWFWGSGGCYYLTQGLVCVPKGSLSVQSG